MPSGNCTTRSLRHDFCMVESKEIESCEFPSQCSQNRFACRTHRHLPRCIFTVAQQHHHALYHSTAADKLPFTADLHQSMYRLQRCSRPWCLQRCSQRCSHSCQSRQSSNLQRASLLEKHAIHTIREKEHYPKDVDILPGKHLFHFGVIILGHLPRAGTRSSAVDVRMTLGTIRRRTANH